MTALIDALLPLIGIWSGTGVATYPDRDTAIYREQWALQTDVAQTLLQYEQKTWVAHQLLAWEFGFIRPIENGHIDLINTQNNGRTEVLRGQVTTQGEGLSLVLNSVDYGNDDKMLHARRTIQVSGRALHYQVWIATKTHSELFQHLKTQLTKV